MPSLYEALTQMGAGVVDPVRTAGINSQFTRDLPGFVQKVASDYLSHQIDLNTSIAKIATEHNLNDEQTQRIIAEANNQVYMTKFAQLKGSDKRVEFDLASKKGVENAKNPKKLEKTASVKAMDFDDYTGRYSYTDLSPAAQTDFTKIAAKRISRELSRIDEGIAKQANLIADNLFASAQAMLKQESIVPGSAQNIFDELCKTAHILPEMQLLYKQAMAEKAKVLKTEHRVPQNINANLDTCDIFEKKADYSLGEYSLLENERQNGWTFTSDTGIIIKGPDGLSKIASEIKGEMQALSELQKARQNLTDSVKTALDNE